MKQTLAKHAGLVAVLVFCALVGCARRAGRTYVEIENDQGSVAGPAQPVMVDPRVEVLKNEYQRLYGSDGSSVRQRMVIRGPVMIVPAAPAAAQPPVPTQPDVR
jgi:hypothetical protein